MQQRHQQFRLFLTLQYNKLGGTDVFRQERKDGKPAYCTAEPAHQTSCTMVPESLYGVVHDHVQSGCCKKHMIGG